MDTGVPRLLAMPAHTRHRLPFLHPASPALLLVPVALLAALVMTSSTVVHLDGLLGRVARGAGGTPRHVEFLVTALGGTDVVMPLTAAAALVLCLLRHWQGAVTLVLAVVATQAVVDLIKVVVERPRPAANQAIADASGSSFPSAHSATSMALYATLALLAARACRGKTRLGVAAVGAAVVVAVGLSRVLLAAHYPTDVLAGWLVGAALVAGSCVLVGRLRAPRLLAQAA